MTAPALLTRTAASRPGPKPLRRSIPFWVLLAGSIASFGYGAWLVVDKVSTMTATLADGSATGIEVYAGQSWITVGAAFIGAGLLGLVTVLALAVLRSFVAVPAADVELEPHEELSPEADALGYDPQLGYVAPAAEDASPSPAADAELPEAVSTGR